MNNQLNNFMLCVKNIPQLRKVFVSCKSLEESYDKFKIMLNGFTFEEYKKFFDDLATEDKALSEEDLAGVAGGFSIRGMITPVAIMTMLSGTMSSASFANETSLLRSGGSPVRIEQSTSERENDQEQQVVEETSTDNKEISEAEEIEEVKDTTEGEIAYSLQYIERLPKKGDKGFELFTKLPDQSNFQEEREVFIKHQDGSTEVKTINEKEVYKQIEETVKQLISKVERRTPGEDLSEDDIELKIANKELSKHYKLSKQMRIAKAIYRWVANNILYDDETLDAIKKKDGTWKPQDALFVFSQKSGVCDGYARLTDLMMKMADIPCSYVCSIDGRNEDYGHAFNAVYLDDTTNGREGWTLIDATWASPRSDKDFLSNWVYIKPLIEGVQAFYPNFFEDKLDRHDDYIKELANAFDIPYEQQEKLDDKDIEDLNQKASKIFADLNEKYKEGRKFESIEFFKGEYGLNIKYKTNLTREEAANILEEQSEREKEESKKTEINNIINRTCLFVEGNYPQQSENIKEDLDYSFLDDLNDINVIKNPALKERSTEYTEKVRKIYSDAIPNNADNLKSKLDEINSEIEKNLDKLNLEYQDIITLKKLEVYLKLNSFDGDDSFYDLFVNVTRSLSENEAESIYEKQLSQLGEELHSARNADLKVFFPGFYNEDKSLQEANRSIIEYDYHKISSFDSKKFDFDGTYKFEINGLQFSLSGHETKACINIFCPSEKPAENVVIPKELSDFEIPFDIGYGIKSLVLTGNEIIDISSANSLDSIDCTHSNKYIVENGFLCEKDASGNNGKPISRIKKQGKIGDLCYENFEGWEDIHLSGEDDNNPAENVVIPKELLDLGMPFKIGTGIKSLILTGDEIIDISSAFDLESIDCTRSNKYIVENGFLCEKDASGNNGKPISRIKKQGKIGDLCYTVREFSTDIYLYRDDDNPAENVVIPKELLDLGMPFDIGDGIKSLVLTGDETIYISSANDLESIDCTHSNKYIFEDGTLYEKTASGQKGEQITTLGTH